MCVCYLIVIDLFVLNQFIYFATSSYNSIVLSFLTTNLHGLVTGNEVKTHFY